MKVVYWIGSTLDDLKAFPKEVREVMGYALYLAQCGGKHPGAKPLKGFGGAGVVEAMDDYDGDTYRTVYTVKLANAVYALHAFQKKSKKGSKTPKSEIELVKERLKRAQKHHALQKAAQKGKKR